MKWRERWASLSLDARLAGIVAGCFVLWLALHVVFGPPVVFLAPWCLVYPLLALIVVLLVLRLRLQPISVRKTVPFLVVSGCLATFWLVPWETICMDLHLVLRVYLAGGPKALNDWAQEMIEEKVGTDDPRVPPSLAPLGVRRHLSGSVMVVSRDRNERGQLRIELGGGFYHYGVVVVPEDKAPPAEWWQRLLGWPPEVRVDHE